MTHLTPTTANRLVRLVLALSILALVLTGSSCNGNVYVGVSAGPWVGYPYGGAYPYGGGGVYVGRPFPY